MPHCKPADPVVLHQERCTPVFLDRVDRFDRVLSDYHEAIQRTHERLAQGAAANEEAALISDLERQTRSLRDEIRAHADFVRAVRDFSRDQGYLGIARALTGHVEHLHGMATRAENLLM